VSTAGRPARLLWLIKGLGPGGAERLLVSAARAHDRERFALSAAYLLPWKHALVGELEAAGVVVHCLDSRRAFDMRWMARLRRLLMEPPGFDLLHLHSPLVAAMARLVVPTVPARLRPRVVSTEHNEWWSFKQPTRIVNAITFPFDDAHVAVSDAVRESVPARLRPRVHTIVHGLPVEDAEAARTQRDAARAELGFGPTDIVVGTIANFLAQKSYPDLLAAVRVAADRVPDLSAVAVGQGPLEAEIKQAHAALGLGNRFRLLGYRSDPLRVLAACDIFALASRYEGYPVAIMEALAVGLPVVATEVGGVRDAVRDDVEGLLVPPGRPDLLARALEDLARDPERRARMAAAARARGRQYDIVHAVRRIEDVYERLIR
jgi:glycosyltransferase involved in cell wall biosynthesis